MVLTQRKVQISNIPLFDWDNDAQVAKSIKESNKIKESNNKFFKKKIVSYNSIISREKIELSSNPEFSLKI